MAANNGSAVLRHVYSPLPATTRGASASLKCDPKAQRLIYCNGRSVVMRSIDNPLVSELYQQHVAQVTSAAWSPSGFYVASGDETGRLRIWDAVNAEHILANEFQPLSGRVNDLAFSGDNERLVIVGDGRERFGAAILVKTGSSVGAIAGHSKQILSCTFKPTRPFRVATGSEDNTVAFHQGPPFKFDHADPGHARFVNTVAYAPDGSRFVSGSSDTKIHVFDGASGERTGVLEGHTGSVFACSWSPDSAFLLSASGDKTCKVWNMADLTCVQTFTLGKSVDDQQVSCIWAGANLISLSLSGALNYLDRTNPDVPLRVLMGHKVAITSMAVDAATRTIFTGSYDGRVVAWNFDAAEQAMLTGTGHGSQVSDIGLVGDALVTLGHDDSLAISSASGRAFGSVIKLDSTPYGVAVAPADPSLVVAVYNGGVAVVRGTAVVSTTALGNNPQCVSISTNGDVAIGCSDGVHLFTVRGDALVAKGTLEGQHRGQVVAASYSADGLLATADAARNIVVWNADGSAKVAGGIWVHHSAKVTKLAWSPDGNLASSSLDGALIIWRPNNPGSRITLANAHIGGANACVWIDNNTLASAGADAALKTWNVTW